MKRWRFPDGFPNSRKVDFLIKQLFWAIHLSSNVGEVERVLWNLESKHNSNNTVYQV